MVADILANRPAEAFEIGEPSRQPISALVGEIGSFPAGTLRSLFCSLTKKAAANENPPVTLPG